MTDKKLFSIKTPFSEVNIYLQKNNYCEDASKFYSNLLKENINISFGKAIEKTEEGWAIWALKICRSDFDSSVIEALISRIISPASAFSVYLKIDNLTDNEYNMLKNIFEGQLPTSEAKLKTNKLIPVRRINNG